MHAHACIKLWGLEKGFTIDPIDLAALIIICSLVGIFGLYKFTRRKLAKPTSQVITGIILPSP